MSQIRPSSDSNCARVLHSLQSLYISASSGSWRSKHHEPPDGDSPCKHVLCGVHPPGSGVECFRDGCRSDWPAGMNDLYRKVLGFFTSILGYRELLRIEIFWQCRTSGIFCEARCIRRNGCLQDIARHDVQDNVLICFCQQKNVERSGITSTHRNMHTRSHAHAHARAHTLYLRNFVVCTANTCCPLQYIINMITNLISSSSSSSSSLLSTTQKVWGGSTGTGQT